MILGYMARDQYGATLHLTEAKHPRKQLLEKTGGRHVAKMYIDSKSSGCSRHIGYVVNSGWWTLYEVHEWSGGAS